jgi:hypothetical protein
MRRPWSSKNGVGVGVLAQPSLQQEIHPSALVSTPKNVTIGPCPVSVGVAEAVGVELRVGVDVALTVGEEVAVRLEVRVGLALGVNVGE